MIYTGRIIVGVNILIATRKRVSAGMPQSEYLQKGGAHVWEDSLLPTLEAIYEAARTV